jgi:hypothetical protein
MESGSVDLRMIRGLLWALILVLFGSLSLAAFLSSRQLDVRLRVRVRRPQPGLTRTLRAALFMAGLMMVLLLALEITAGEHWQLRAPVVAISGLVTMVGAHLCWNLVRESIRRREDEAAYWRQRGIETARLLYEAGSAQELKQRACESLVDELELSRVALYEWNGRVLLRTADRGGRDALPVEWPSDGAAPALLRENQPARAFALRGAEICGARYPLTLDEALAAESIAASGLVLLYAEDQPAGMMLLGGRLDGQALRPAQLAYAASAGDSLARALLDIGRQEAAVARARETTLREGESRMFQAALIELAAPERPEVPGLDYGWGGWRPSAPAAALLDCVALPNRSVGWVLAETEGPAVEGMLRLIRLQALLRSRFWAYRDDLGELVESAERALLSGSGQTTRVRLCVARYEPQNRTLFCVNAGFYAPFVLRRHEEGAEVLRVAAAGGPLGDEDHPPFREEAIRLRRGDLAAILTAGVAEARSPEDKPWGETALADTLLGGELQPAQEIVDATLEAVHEFTAGNPAAPPRLLVVIRAGGFTESPLDSGMPPQAWRPA